MISNDLKFINTATNVSGYEFTTNYKWYTYMIFGIKIKKYCS